MGLSNQDVEMLNNSMRYAGGAFRQSRLDEEQLKQQKIENELRERTLKAGQDRTDLEASGQISVYFEGADGVQGEYHGVPKGWDKFSSGRALKTIPKPTTVPPFEMSVNYPGASVKYHLTKPEDLQRALAEAAKAGGKAPGEKQPGESKTAPIMNDEHLAKLEEAVAAAQNPEEKARAEYALKRFRDLLPTRTDEDMETVTEEYPGQEATPPVPPQTKGVLWWKHEVPGTGQPAKPAVPPRKVSYKQPRGTATDNRRTTDGQPTDNRRTEPPPMPVPQAAAAATNAPAKVLTPEVAKQYLAKYKDRAKAEAAAKADGFTW